MNSFNNVFQRSNFAARIYSRKKSRILYNQTKSMSHEISQREKEAFYNLKHDVLDSIAAHPAVREIPDLEGWIKKLFNHNMVGGKAARGQNVVMAYEMLEKPENITNESMKMAHILGWCVEMIQSYLVILDDMMDASTKRRGQPCWYLLPGVGASCAINDSVLVYNSMLYLMRKNFGSRTNYVDMLDTLNKTMLYTSFGQFLDVKTSIDANKDYKTFTPERHLAIVKYKTAYYTYDLPVTLGFLLTGNKLDKKARKQVQNLTLHLGILFQIQDDFIDCYSDETLTGKAGTDIQEGKCSWLAVNALQRCSDSQRIVFSACYGSKEPAHIERIKRLYDQLRLPELYRQVEEHYHHEITEKIKELPTKEWKRLFSRMLGITYQRMK